jgi:hypothetical protein
VDKKVPKMIAALPFIRQSKRGEKGPHCWWAVKPTGDYGKDYDQGQEWARLVVPLLKYNVGAPLLSWIVVDMIKAGERNGLVLGFAREIGDQLKRTRAVLMWAVIGTDRKAGAEVP